MKKVYTLEQYNNLTQNDKEIVFSTRHFNERIIIRNFTRSINFQIIKCYICDFNQKIIIPNSVKIIGLSYDYNQNIILPNTIKNIMFINCFCKCLRLPKFVQKIELNNWCVNINKIPNYTLSIHIENDSQFIHEYSHIKKYLYINLFTNYVYFIKYHNFDIKKRLIIPNSTYCIDINSLSEKKTELPNSVQKITNTTQRFYSIIPKNT